MIMHRKAQSKSCFTKKQRTSSLTFATTWSQKSAAPCTCIAMVFVDNNITRGKQNSHDKNQKERNQNTVISSVAPGILTFK